MSRFSKGAEKETKNGPRSKIDITPPTTAIVLHADLLLVKNLNTTIPLRKTHISNNKKLAGLKTSKLNVLPDETAPLKPSSQLKTNLNPA